LFPDVKFVVTEVILFSICF